MTEPLGLGLLCVVAAYRGSLVRVADRRHWRLPGTLLLVTAGLALVPPPGAVAAPSITLMPACGPAGGSAHTFTVVGTGFSPGEVEALRVTEPSGTISQREIGPADGAGTLSAEFTVSSTEGSSLVGVGEAVASFVVPCSDATATPEPTTVQTTPVAGTPVAGTPVAGASPGGTSPGGTTPGGTNPGGIRRPATTTRAATPAAPTPEPANPAAPVETTPEPATAVVTAPGTSTPDGTTTSTSQGESSFGLYALLAGGLGLVGALALLFWRRLSPPIRLQPSRWGEVVWRRALVELTAERAPPGSRVHVTLFTDAAPLAAQEPQSAAARSGGSSEGKGILVVDVRLLCSGELAVVEAPGFKSMTIERGTNRSSDVVFSVLLSPDAPDGSVLRLTALFSHNNRPCGYLYTDVAIQAAAPPPTAPASAPGPSRGPGLGFRLTGTSNLVPAGPPAPTARSERAAAAAILRIEPGASPPDVLVRVTATQANDGRTFLCEVITRFGPGAHEPEPWNLPDTAPRLVEALMAEFTAEEMTPRHRRDTLVGAGAELFDVAPSNFKETLWRLFDDATPPRSIFVCTEEPAIPWELMIPNRDTRAGTEYRQPLGVELAVGRWVGDPSSDPRLGNPHQAPLQVGAMVSSVVIAPNYTSGDLVLERAPAEVELVMGHLPGTRVTPALYDQIDAGLAATDAGLLHFVGHGRAEARGAHVLVLEKEETLSSTALRGMEGARSFGGRCHPVVFLNGCEIGRLKPTLAGADGFAKTLIRQGARSVIAPLWSVTDSIAHEVATEFYEQHARHPDAPLGQVFQAIRGRAYDPQGGQDSYAAYAFFGDPLSRTQA